MLGMGIMVCCSCKKSIDQSSLNNIEQVTVNNYSNIQYTIKQGNQYCDKNAYQAVNTAELKFIVKFDSSAIYQTINSGNQVDINKLYGFSDNNADHHQFSARFGWRWKNNALEIFAYIYNNGNMCFQQIGIAKIGEETTCNIKIAGCSYVFSMNNYSITMPRASTTSTAIGYKLYPYFGGDEMAPHDISIWIKEIM